MASLLSSVAERLLISAESGLDLETETLEWEPIIEFEDQRFSWRFRRDLLIFFPLCVALIQSPVQYRTKFNCLNYRVFVKEISKLDKELEQVQRKTTHAPLCFELQAGLNWRQARRDVYLENFNGIQEREICALLFHGSLIYFSSSTGIKLNAHSIVTSKFHERSYSSCPGPPRLLSPSPSPLPAILCDVSFVPGTDQML